MKFEILRRRTWKKLSETVKLSSTFEVSKETVYNKESLFSLYSFSKIWVQEILRQISASGFKARSFTISVISPSSSFCPFAAACFYTSVECSYNKASCRRIYCLNFIVHSTIETPSNVTNDSAFRGCLGWYQFTKGQQQPELVITSPIPTTYIFSRQPFYAATGCWRCLRC